MYIEYGKKSYTQGYLRQIIKEKRKQGLTLGKIQNDLHIGSTATIHKWANSNTVKSKHIMNRIRKNEI